MLVVRGESRLPAEELLRKAKRLEIVLLNPREVESLEELELAYVLTKKSIAERKAVGKGLKSEFVLWLAGKRDVKRAFEEVGWKGGEMIVVSFGMRKKDLVAELEMKERELGLKKEARWGAVERISLSRIV